MIPSPTTANALRQLGTFLRAVLEPDVEVVVGQVNRVPEPKPGSFVVMTPIRATRIRTNVDAYRDCKFAGSIAETTLTVTAVDPDLDGPIQVGQTVFGVDVLAGTRITALGSGTGGAGTYAIDKAQTLSGRTLSTGVETLEQGQNLVVQLDFHSADPLREGEMATVVSTLMRDEFAVRQFAEQVPNFGVVPLLADDPRQMPFINREQQWEFRWIVDCQLQVNAVVTAPQQFADSAEVEVVSVDAAYPS